MKNMKHDYLLETPEERIKLLKAGLTSKRIEELYIERNNFKLVNVPILYENVKVDMLQDEKTIDAKTNLRYISLKWLANYPYSIKKRAIMAGNTT